MSRAIRPGKVRWVLERLEETVEVVGTGRFELPTCRLGGDRSIHLSYVPVGHKTILATPELHNQHPLTSHFLYSVFLVFHMAPNLQGTLTMLGVIMNPDAFA